MSTEGQVRVRVTGDVERVGILEDVVVVVGAGVVEADPLALLDLDVADLTSLSAVRWKTVTGVAQRMTSSTIVSGRSAFHSSHWSGCSKNAFMPWVIALRVVSLPATVSMMTK